MKRFYDTESDMEYVKSIAGKLNSYDGFYGKYRGVVFKDNPFEIVCGVVLKDNLQIYDNFLCDIYFDRSKNYIAVDLCLIYNPKKDKTVRFCDVENKTFDEFADWLIDQMEYYLCRNDLSFA